MFASSSDSQPAQHSHGQGDTKSECVCFLGMVIVYHNIVDYSTLIPYLGTTNLCKILKIIPQNGPFIIFSLWSKNNYIFTSTNPSTCVYIFMIIYENTQTTIVDAAGVDKDNDVYAALSVCVLNHEK